MSDFNQQKKLMRIALVGIRPADQITLKGYFRVLLRLDVDLEWVSATASNVHLFIINNEFRSAGSVAKLVETNPSVPALYVDRTDLGDGGIKQDLLTLPLKQIQQLNDWLMSHVVVLSGEQTAGASTQVLARASEKLSDADSKPAEEGVQLKDFIELIKALQTKHQNSYEIVDNGTVVAMVDGGRQLVWSSGAPKISPAWRLRPYTGAAKDPKMAVDSVQWLYQLAWQNPQSLLGLVNDTDKHQLRFWMKPAQMDRRDLLQIMTAMESAPVSVVEIASKARVSVLTAKKAVVAFLVAGVLQSNSYKTLSVQAVQTTTETPNIPVAEPVQAPEPTPASAQQEEKIGFLSRLRRKLGL